MLSPLNESDGHDKAANNGASDVKYQLHNKPILVEETGVHRGNHDPSESVIDFNTARHQYQTHNTSGLYGLYSEIEPTFIVAMIHHCRVKQY